MLGGEETGQNKAETISAEDIRRFEFQKAKTAEFEGDFKAFAGCLRDAGLEEELNTIALLAVQNGARRAYTLLCAKGLNKIFAGALGGVVFRALLHIERGPAFFFLIGIETNISRLN